MEIRFPFNLEKAMQAVCYLLERLGGVDKVKLMKLLYLAERAHYIRTGVSVTGDRLVAMPHGPVPSTTLSAINGEMSWNGEDAVFPYIHLDDHVVQFRASPGRALLSADERQTLDQVIDEHGAKDTWKLVRETHRLPEYVACYVEGTSRTIPFERIAKFSGSESRFRHDRPVVSPATAAALPCPFDAGADVDL